MRVETRAVQGRQQRRWWLRVVPAAFLLLLLLAVLVLPRQIAQRLNGVVPDSTAMVSAQAAVLHQELFVADLHADALLWQRDLLERASYGHVDLPRLAAGNVALQVFSVVTKVPRTLDYDYNDGRSDLITPLAMVQLWPPRTWGSLQARALHQAGKLQEYARRAPHRLVLIQTANDLAQFVARRQREPQLVAGLLALEGMHALEGDLSNLERLLHAGFRMMGGAHFFDNEFGGSAHGAEKGGLTDLGRQALARMAELRIIVDLAHASPRLFEEVLQLTHHPVVVSHTGVKGTCDNNRNLSDAQLQRLAEKGGIVGVGLWDGAVCATEVQATARAMRYTANLIGVEHVALGSDFDGAVHAPIDAAGMAQLTAALLAEGFSPQEIRQIMGGNVLRFLQATLPQQ